MAATRSTRHTATAMAALAATALLSSCSLLGGERDPNPGPNYEIGDLDGFQLSADNPWWTDPIVRTAEDELESANLWWPQESFAPAECSAFNHGESYLVTSDESIEGGDDDATISFGSVGRDDGGYFNVAARVFDSPDDARAFIAHVEDAAHECEDGYDFDGDVVTWWVRSIEIEPIDSDHRYVVALASDVVPDETTGIQGNWTTYLSIHRNVVIGVGYGFEGNDTASDDAMDLIDAFAEHLE